MNNKNTASHNLQVKCAKGSKSKSSKSTKKQKESLFCISKCKLKGKESDSMIRCCGCNKWFHHVCVDENPSETGIWNCDSCSATSSVILSL